MSNQNLITYITPLEALIVANIESLPGITILYSVLSETMVTQA